MITDGARHDLYSFAAQNLYQIRFHRPPDTLFRNPPIALIPILPLTFLPAAAAFAVWTALSIVLLIVSLKVLEKETDLRFGNWPILLGLLFVPILDSLLHGQFTVCIVLVYVLTYAQWRKGNRAMGGAILAQAEMKFQLVVGFIAILLLRRKWRELAGFTAASALLVAISVAMAGVKSLQTYPQFVLYSDPPLSELSHMANWQGLFSLMGKNDSIWIFLLSIGTVIWAARAWTNLDRGFCAAVLASMLVSYHLTPQDISLAIVPFYLSVNAGILPRAKVPLFAGLGMALLMLAIFVQIPIALVSLLLIVALVWVGIHPQGADNRNAVSASLTNSLIIETIRELYLPVWACGAVGSALPWHGRGHRFDPDQVHQSTHSQSDEWLQGIRVHQHLTACSRPHKSDPHPPAVRLSSKAFSASAILSLDGWIATFPPHPRAPASRSSHRPQPTYISRFPEPRQTAVPAAGLSHGEGTD
jgi:hypothetical protein